MIRGVNAAAFERELQAELGQLERDITAAENDLAREFLADVQAATPVRTGRLSESWGIAVGDPDPTDPGGGTEALETRLPQQPVYVQNNDFRASFLEHGTPTMAPRPMVAPALERLSRKVIRL